MNRMSPPTPLLKRLSNGSEAEKKSPRANVPGDKQKSRNRHSEYRFLLLFLFCVLVFLSVLVFLFLVEKNLIHGEIEEELES